MTRPHTQPPMRPRDPMDVGLDRHSKRGAKRHFAPVWLEERLGWISIVAVAIGVGLPLGFIGSAPSTTSGPQAQLFVSYGPARVWLPGSQTHLRSITVKVHNRGPVSATGVSVNATVSGQTFALTGKDSIALGNTEEYSAFTDVNATAADAIAVKLSCQNCAGSTPHDPHGGESNPFAHEHAVLSGKH